MSFISYDFTTVTNASNAAQVSAAAAAAAATAANVSATAAKSQLEGLTLLAWVLFKGNGASNPVILSSSNIATMTRAALGVYDLTFTAALPNANYIANAPLMPTGQVVTLQNLVAASCQVVTTQFTAGALASVEATNIAHYVGIYG
jgi:hypothetical protein